MEAFMWKKRDKIILLLIKKSWKEGYGRVAPSGGQRVKTPLVHPSPPESQFGNRGSSGDLP